MPKSPYREEFLHPNWIDKKNLIIKRDRYRCIFCGYPYIDKRKTRFWDNRERKLVIHFKCYIFSLSENKYIDPWNYDDSLLITCDTWCLEKGLKLFNVPIYKIN